MVVEDFSTFGEWLPVALLVFVAILAGIVLLGTLYGYLISAARHGPGEAFYVVAKVYADAVPDIIGTSLRRIYAIAVLSVKEVLQRRVLLVTFGIFALVNLVGSWFLGSATDHPDRVYISYALFLTQILVLVLALVLSAFSLPTDIKDKTIYTIVTKPVRSTEIILGRIVGFVAIGTLLLTVMWLVSYVVVVRGLSHSHQEAAGSFKAPDAPSATTPDGSADPKRVLLEGETTVSRGHSHKITVLADGSAFTDVQKGHWHPVTVVGEGDDVKYSIGPQQGMLQARVPIYGKLRFLNRSGRPGRGVNVGNEWQYREYIEGATGAAAIWRFAGLSKDDFTQSDGTRRLPIELTLSVFRTWKGRDIKETVAGVIILKNPTSGAESDQLPFRSQEYSDQRIDLPEELNGTDSRGRSRTVKGGDPLMLFDDLVDGNGQLDVIIKCAEPGQYFGAAQADCYIRASGATFFGNFFKGYVGIWFQMIIVVCLGVMFSTFLNREVTLLATALLILIGIFYIDWIREYAIDDRGGGGPIEASIRIVTQKNPVTDLDAGILEGPIKVVDWCLIQMLHGLTYVIPDFGNFDTSEQVASGYNINLHSFGKHLCITLAFFVVLTFMSYFILRTREIAA